MKKITASYFISILGGVTLSLAVGFLSSIVTQQAIPNWYAALVKPFFSPPNWLFAPVWTLLYILMGWAVGSVWHYGKRHRWGKTALYHFGAQLIFNGLWSLVFFGFLSLKMIKFICFVVSILSFLMKFSQFIKNNFCF